MMNILWGTLLLGLFLVVGSVYAKEKEEKGWGFLLALGLWLAGGSGVLLIRLLFGEAHA